MSETVPSSCMGSRNKCAGVLFRLAVVGVWVAVGIYLSKWGRACGDHNIHSQSGKFLAMTETEASSRAAPWSGYQITLFYLAVTGVLTAIGTCLHKAFRDCYYSIRDRVFQYLGITFDISSHRIDSAATMSIILVLLERLGFNTYQYYWYHDANAVTKDRMQHGSLRFPCKSYLLLVLSYLEISHYAYIPHNVREITMVGPSTAIMRLLEESNGCTGGLSAASVPLPALQKAFGCGPHITSLDKVCLRTELVLFPFLGLVCLGAGGFCVNSGWHSGIGFSCFVLALCFVMVFAKQLRVLRKTKDSDTANLHTPLLVGDMGEEQASIPLDVDEWTPAVEESVVSVPEEYTEDPYGITFHRESYTLLTCRGPHYEGSQQVKFTLNHPDRQDIRCTEGKAHLYTIPTIAYVADHVAARTRCSVQGELLYICVHNPFMDVPLVEGLEILRKNPSQPKVVVVILPRLENLVKQMHSNASCSVFMVDHKTRIIRTQMDFEQWMAQCSAGVIHKLIFIIPHFRREEKLEGQDLLTHLKDTLDVDELPANTGGDVDNQPAGWARGR